MAPELKQFLKLASVVLLTVSFSACTLPDQQASNEDITEMTGEASPVAEEGDNFADDFADNFESELADNGASSSPKQESDQAFELEEPAIAQNTEEEFQGETLQTEPLAPESVSQSKTPAPVATQARPGSSPLVITSIDFLKNNNGGTISIQSSAPITYNARYNPNTRQYVIEVPNAILSSTMRRPLIMKDFATPFGAINAYQAPGSQVARIVIQMKNSGEPIVQQEGSALVIMPATSTATSSFASASESITPREESFDVTAAARDEALGAKTLDEFLTGSSRFYGKPISIQTNDADVRDVISFIAEESGVNLVIGDDVEGKVSLKLREVPWDQALVIIMKARGLGYVRQGNVIRITKLSTLQAESTLAKNIVDAQKVIAPLRVKVIPVSYATVADLENQVKPFLTFERGKVVSDARTSSLIITDTADVLEKISRLVRELDIPPAQVLIEGKVVEAGESFSRNIGMSWGFTGANVELSNKGGLNNTPINMNVGFRSQPVDQSVLTGGQGVLGLRIGSFDFLGNLDATLSLAQSDSLVRIISSPRVVTVNKQKAEILQKSEVLSIRTTRQEGSDSVINAEIQRTPAQLKLAVTPQVTNEGSVVLDVEVLREFAGAEFDSQTKARPVNSRSATTKVLVPNGQTAVIGGIYQNDESSGESGVPILKDIPVIGWLFKSKREERIKNELIIFLTPRILNSKDQAVM